MSTRCNLLVQDNVKGEHILYRHCDGMPDSAGEEIKKFLKDYVKNTEIPYNYEDISNGIIDDLGFEDEGTVAGDINYFYEIIVYPNTIFYTCRHVPVFAKYDIYALDDNQDCEEIECEEFNNCNIPIETIEKAEDLIFDSKKLLKYVDERNKFIDKLMEKYTIEAGISKDAYRKALEVSYNQGYNNHLIESI